MKNKIIAAVLIIIFCFAVIKCLNYFDPFEKWQWEKEQEELLKEDIVVYSQWSDRFGWRGGNKIYTDYKTNNGMYGITDETNRHYENVDMGIDSLILKFPDSEYPYTDIKKVDLNEYEFLKSEYFFITELDEFSWLADAAEDDISPDNRYIFYILDDKYLISGNGKDITGSFGKDIADSLGKDITGIFCRVDVFDIENKERYYYSKALIANRPENTLVEDKLIEPKYYMDQKGRIICIYKYYNKLLCHRIN